jgi:hypothetical protein
MQGMMPLLRQFLIVRGVSPSAVAISVTVFNSPLPGRRYFFHCLRRFIFLRGLLATTSPLSSNIKTILLRLLKAASLAAHRFVF